MATKKLKNITFGEFCNYCEHTGIYMDSEKKCLRKCPFAELCKNELNESGLPCARWRKYLDEDITLDIS